MSNAELETFAIEVVKTLKSAGFEAVFAGGCVRDRLMGIPPKDFDVATNALPDDVRRLFPRTVPVGEAFNVILVLSSHEENPFHVEVATFRKDVGIADGRHPAQVLSATAEEDVQRRDFTVNGMLYDPLEDKLLDWVGGQKDLKAKILRSIGEPHLRIDEDHLRMLRAIRFSSRFGFQIDPSLMTAIQSKASLIRKISAERIYEELTKILTGARADLAMDDLASSGLLEQLIPEALAMKGCEQPPEHHPEGDVWVHTLLLLKQCAGKSPEVGWAALLHDIAKPPTFSHTPGDRIRFNGHAELGAEMSVQILKRFKASNDLIECVHELVRDHLKFKDAPQMRPSTLKRWLRSPHFEKHLELHYIDCMACHQNLTLYEFCKSALANMPPDILRPPKLVDGNDLISMGFRPGPQFKEILDAVETEQLEQRLFERMAAIEFVKAKYGSLNR